MPARGFDHFNLHAPRELPEKMRRFYLDAIGLHEGPRLPFRSHGCRSLREAAGNGIELNFASGAQLPKPDGVPGA
ncbi:hypothetical protein CSC70_05345 [Pseudoxanthomonas kalamensis DSM 18571]|uniref:hypothetical protein n=1 Tax=Pseudoxanthomonas kalamensis TaxID=289483 RepID=UPI001390F7AF|nr:hypothetical protein [Pseudoxanthomonas kalamensis]KAF1711335.1 hypothetical protein CSC70_05345 [Pseudoxanthomonas kalamensis DSM 18571]